MMEGFTFLTFIICLIFAVLMDTAPTEEWEFEVLSIFTTKTIEELKEEFKNKEDE